MELSLINGIYPKQDAIKIVSDIFSIKLQYHRNRIESGVLTPEESAHSQMRIGQLEESLDRLVKKIQDHRESKLNIEAHIDLNIFAPVTQWTEHSAEKNVILVHRQKTGDYLFKPPLQTA